MSLSQVRQNFHQDCESAINRQINHKLHCSYVYQSMALHFDRDSLALPGFHKFFKKLSDEDRDDAEKLMEYQNKRGGRVNLQDIMQPDGNEWGCGLDAMKTALHLEKKCNEGLHVLHKISDKHNDAQLSDFLESEFMQQQVDSVKLVGDYVTQLKRVAPGLGEYLFDKEHLQE